jgi:hypothetical protein
LGIVEDTNLAAIHAKRVTIQLKDLALQIAGPAFLGFFVSFSFVTLTVATSLSFCAHQGLQRRAAPCTNNK